MNNSRPKQQKADEFMGLFSRHSLRVYGFVRALVPVYEDAHDVFQNTSVVLWKKFDDYESGTDFFAWACRVARFEVFAHYRRDNRRRLFSDAMLDALAADAIDRSSELNLRAAALSACVERLEARDRRLIEQRYDRGLKADEIAAAVSRSVSSIYRSLARVHDQLQRCVEKKLSSELS